jgi:hypothetical protein
MEGYLGELTNHSFSKVDQILTLERIREDLYVYLDFKTNDHVTVEAANEDAIAKDIVVSKNDEVTILNKKIVFADSRLAYFPLTVSLGIGNIELSHGSFLVEKCTAELIYNHDLELIDADFFCHSVDIL